MPGACGIYEALWLARLHQEPAQALYLHVPFCAQKCAYCDFASWATPAGDPLIDAYMVALRRLLAQACDAGLLEGCQTAYVGGGTPTLAGDTLVQLLESVSQSCPQLQELSCEANPDSLSDHLLQRLPEAGCTRLSIGVQSLQDRELQALGRIHDARTAVDRLRAAVATNIDVSCDLMCAIPAQTDESWRQTLEGVLACGVGHMSVYPLQIEEGTPFDACYGDDELPWHDPSVQAARMEMAARELEQAGFARYEVASYAHSGKECRHNQSYWTAVPYLGLGSQASSMLTREGYLRLRQAAPGLPEPDDDTRRVRLTCTNSRWDIAEARSFTDLRFDLEFMTEQQAAAEDLMLAMRMTSGAGPGLLAHARTVLGATKVDDALAWCESRGLAHPVGLNWAPTTEGWLLGNELYGKLWDLAAE